MEIPLPDGDRLVGRWFNGQSDKTLSIFHGLGGSTDAGYMRRSARIALSLGYNVLLVNHRGSGEGFGLARGTPHSGRGEDISAGIAWARAKRPGDMHVALGFSMSGNALLLLLAGLRGDVRPDRAIVVNAPIDLDDASVKLTRGLNRIYDFRFLNECRRDFRARRTLGLMDRDFVISPFSTLRDFDNLCTAPLNGFRDREDYYSQCSTQAHLGKIRVPTFLLTAADDPFVDVRAYREAKPSEFVRLHVEPVGGHMGYLSRVVTPLGTRRWLDYAVSQALSALN